MNAPPEGLDRFGLRPVPPLTPKELIVIREGILTGLATTGLTGHVAFRKAQAIIELLSDPEELARINALRMGGVELYRRPE